MIHESILRQRLRSRLTQAERLGFSRRLIALPAALFLAVAAVYPAAVYLTLAAPMPLALLLSPACGFVIGVLFIIGHDACHKSFTGSFWLNHIIGRLAFLPALHSFTAWDIGHNQMHHGYNNLRGWDQVWEPMSPGDYRVSGPLRRMMYRWYRSPAGVPFYYMIALWAPYLCATPLFVRRRMGAMLFLDLALVLLFLACQVAAVITLGSTFNHGALVSVLLGVVVPFLIWNGLMSTIIFLHHTHPALRWYADLDVWKADRGAITGTAHVRFAWPIGGSILWIMEHNAHHVAPGVPLYNLARMQRAMSTHENMLSWRFSLRGFIRVCKRCKLYDYDLDRWVTFQEIKANM